MPVVKTIASEKAPRERQQPPWATRNQPEKSASGDFSRHSKGHAYPLSPEAQQSCRELLPTPTKTVSDVYVGQNLYAFSGNDGVNRWDYLGLVRQQVKNGAGSHRPMQGDRTRRNPHTLGGFYRNGIQLIGRGRGSSRGTYGYSYLAPLRPPLPLPGSRQPITPTRPQIERMPFSEIRPNPLYRDVAPGSILRRPSSRPRSWPTWTESNELARAIERLRERLRGQHQYSLQGLLSRQRQALCKVDKVGRRGGDTFHNRYAKSLGPGEWKVSLPLGKITSDGYTHAQYDGMVSLFTLFEAKTQHQDFPYGNAKAVRDRAMQFAQQESVAKYCGFEYLIAVNNPEGARALRREIPEAPIFYIPFGGGEYQ